MKYTVIKPFVFRGQSFMPGNAFDTDELFCDPHRTRTLMNQRFIAPGYSEKGTIEAQTAKKQANTKAKANAQEKANSEPEGANEPEAPENEPENEPEAPEDEPEGADEPEAPESEPQPQPQSVQKARTSRRS